MKPKVYLAGPISGCNEEQRCAWRRELKRGFGDEFEFIDPMDNLIGSDESGYEVVRADIDAIRTADAVLANMWRESIGTAFGILHAHDASKIVAVCDSNYISSRMVAFYADAVERSLPAALHAIRTLLAAERQIKGVTKSDGSTEPFDRNKLSVSVRKACLSAGQSDIGPPRAIVTTALGKLIGDAKVEKLVTSQEIKDSVWDAMAELGSDPVKDAEYDLVRNAWEKYASGGAPASATAVRPAPPTVKVHDKPLEVRLRSNGTHSTIWGHRVGAEAANIFAEVCRVDGVVEIVLGPFRNTGAPPAKPHVRLVASKTPYIIDGNCYDRGKKGTMQSFQIRVANPEMRDAVLDTARQHLAGLGHIRAMA